MRIPNLLPIAVAALLAGCATPPLSTSPGTSPAGAQSAGAQSAAAEAAPSAAGASGAGASGGTAAGGQAGAGGVAGGGDGGTTVVTARTLDAAEFTTNLRNAAFTKRTATLTMAGDGGLKAQGVVRYGSDLAMALTMTTAGKRIRVVILGSTYYVDPGAKIGGKTWLRIDEHGTDAISKALAPTMGYLRQQSDLSQPSTAFRGVKAVGKAGPVVDGAPTVAYTIRLTSAQLLATVPPDLRTTLGPGLAGATSVSTYYVDSAWLPRKVVVVTTTKGKKATSTLTYGKWGRPVTVAAPPAADVSGSAAA